MAELINMPRLSDTMEEGTVAKWYKKVGDMVKEGDILAEIETDKATMEFEAFQEGELLHIGIEEGGTAPVDSLLAIIGDKGEDIDHIIGGTSASTAQTDESSQTPKFTEPQTEATESNEEKTAMPEGVQVITMPRLSDTMEEGTVAKWNKKVGDPVNEGDILAEIETDKATMEFESFYSGTLLYIGLEEGQSAVVDSILAAIGKEGTDIEAVKRAVRNLINLNHYEKPFHPEIGSNLRAMLFENMTPQMNALISRQIEELIQNYEPRARLVQARTIPLFDRNAYAVTINFQVVNSPEPVVVETLLERLR